MESLGLGLNLYMQDNFTPQVNTALGSFDRLQNGADQMAKEVSKRMMSLQNVMLAGFSLNQVGQGIETAGRKILSAYTGFIGEFTRVNASYDTMQRQLLTSFRGNAGETEKAFKWVRDFSARTPFEVEGLTKAFQKMKSTGMDLRDTFKTTSGHIKTMAESMADLATRNMSPTGGVDGMGIALQNAWSGQMRSLRDRFDIAPMELAKLKEHAGKDLKKFQQEFVNLAYKFAPDAMKNMEGSWEQTVSNINDTWKNFLYDLGKTGVFAEMNKVLLEIAVNMDNIFSNQDNLKAMSDIFKSVIAPIKFIAVGLISIANSIVNFTRENPRLAKILVTLVSIQGIVMVLAGSVMRLTGTFLVAVASIASLSLNMQVMKLQGITITGLFGGLGSAVTSFSKSLGIVGLAGAGIFFAWQRDIWGFRTRTMQAFSDIKGSWKQAKEMLQGKTDINIRLYLPSLVKPFTEKFMTIIAVTKAFWKVFTGQFEDGKMYFDKSDWDIYKKLGIDGLVQGMVYARDKIDHFFAGFADGLTIVYKVGKSVVDFVLTPIKAVMDSIGKYMDKHPNGVITKLFGGGKGVEVSVADNQIKVITGIGKALGTVVGALIAIKALSKIGGFITAPLTRGFSRMSTMGLPPIAVAGQTPNAMPNATPPLVNPPMTRFARLKSYIRGKDITTPYVPYNDPNGSNNSISTGRYRNVNPAQVYSSYGAYHLNDRLNGRQLQTDNRSKFMKSLFGERFYAKNADGTRERIGKFGGLFRQDRDDRTERLMGTSKFHNTVAPQPVGIERYNNRVPIGDPVMKLSQMKGSTVGAQMALSQQGIRTAHQNIARVTNNVSERAGRGFDNKTSNRVSANTGMYNELRAVSATGQLTPKQWDTLQAYRSLGMTGTNYKDIEKQFKSGQLTPDQSRAFSDINNRLRTSYVSQSVARSPQVQGAQLGYQNRVDNRATDSRVFADSRQGGVSRMMFGQRLYTVGQDSKGNYTQNTVGRRGGLFRRESQDYVNNPRSTFGNVARRVVSAPFQLAGAVGRDMLGLAGRTPLRMLGAPLAGIGGAISSVFSGVSASVKTNAMSFVAKVKSGVMGLPRTISNGMQNVGLGIQMWAGGIGSTIAGSRVGQTVARAGGYVGRGASALGRGAINLANRSNTGRLVTGAFGSARDYTRSMLFGDNVTASNGTTRRVGGIIPSMRNNRVGGWWNRQLQRVGLGGSVPAGGEGTPQRRGVANRVLGGMFGRATYDDTGARTGRTRGAVGRAFGATRAVGRGVFRGVGAVGRGIGSLGGRAMGLMYNPYVMLGAMAGRAIKGRGDSVRETINSGTPEGKALAKRLGVQKGDTTFTLGLKSLKSGMKDMDLSTVWKNLMQSAKKNGKIFTDIGKDLWGKVVAVAPKAMTGAWKTLKDLGSFTWEWIKTDGVTMLSDLASKTGELLGKAFEYVCKNAGKWMGKLGELVISTVIPSMIKGVIGLGAFILKYLPDTLNVVFKLGCAILGGLLSFVKSVFVGIGNFLFEAIKGALSGIGKFLLSALAIPIRAIPVIGNTVADKLNLPVHHGGLNLSPTEHMAVIRKDETVLPPTIAKGFDKIIKGGSYSGTKSSSQSAPVDNSVTIENIEVKITAKGVEELDARKHALEVIKEMKKIMREKQLRKYEDSKDVTFSF